MCLINSRNVDAAYEAIDDATKKKLVDSRVKLVQAFSRLSHDSSEVSKADAAKARRNRIRAQRRSRMKGIEAAQTKAGMKNPSYVAPKALGRRRELSFVNVHNIKSLQKKESSRESSSSTASLPIHIKMSPPTAVSGDKPGELRHNMKFL